MKSAKRILSLLIVLGIVSPSFGLDLKFRKYAGEFMEVGVAARAQGLGGAFVAISGDIASTYYNPAGLWNIENTQVSFMHTQQMLASVNYDYLAVARKLGNGRVLALSVVRLGVDNIKDSRQAKIIIDNDWRIDWSKVTSFNSADYIVTFSFAQSWVHDWKVGANFKLIRRTLSDYSANGIGIDLGVQRSFFRNLTLGAALKNATSTLISWNTGEKELVKPSLTVGGTYQLSLPAINSQFRPVVDFIFRGEDRRSTATANIGLISFDWNAGLEYSFRNLLFLRAGKDEIQRFNFGLGFVIPHIRFDYAFTQYDQELGNSHRIGLLIQL